MKARIVPTAAILLLCAACAAPPLGPVTSPMPLPEPTQTPTTSTEAATTALTEVVPRIPTLISHPMPDLNIDRAIYVAAGCNQLTGCPTEGTELASLGCDELLPADPWLGGLSPSYPIAGCSGWTGLYRHGCEEPAYVGYVILQDGELQLITSVAELRAVYAPIESGDEAWSYALAGTGLDAYYFDQVPSRSEFFVERLEDTHVTKKENGYSVSLYHYRLCGCGYHETYATDVLVTVDGDIKQSAAVVVYQDNFERCID